MTNALKAQLQGKVVVLKASVHKAAYAALPYRLFRVEGGFGTSPDTSGRAVFGVYLCDGEKARIDGYDIERFATEEEVVEHSRLHEGEQ